MTNAVVAIGGNAILRKGEAATVENQMNNLRRTCAPLARMVKEGYGVTLVHGNGPQVGNILLQNEIAREEVPPMPLDVCVAQSQGQIGLMLQQAMTEALYKEGISRTVVCLLTRVMVDPAGQNPTPSKPIGPYYGSEGLERLRLNNWTISEDRARGGWRRIVPSPRPLSIIEGGAVRSLVATGEYVVIAAGGGGVPVTKCHNHLCGVEAVVDKDLAAQVLARCIGDELLIMLTDVDAAYLDYKTPIQRGIGETTAAEMRTYLEQGHFAPGSMAPKVEAGVEFTSSTGHTSIITTPELLDNALKSKAGTRIIA